MAFSHGATIMFWVMMNVDNPDFGLMLQHQLDNTEAVVVEGSPEEGWTLVSWAGRPVSADPPLATKLFVNVRDLVVAPQTALYNVGRAFASGDIAALADAVRDGIFEVTQAAVRFVPDTVRDIVDEFRPPAPTPDLRATELDPVPSSADDDSETPADADVVRLAKRGKSNGATDLTGGNKVTPGDKVADSAATDATEETGDGEVTEEVEPAEPADEAPAPADDATDAEPDSDSEQEAA